MDLELKGKTAIVTGGSRGIGKAVGREFGLEWMDVTLVARGREALEATARELAEETGANFITVVADTGDPESVKAMVKEAAEKLGRIDISEERDGFMRLPSGLRDQDYPSGVSRADGRQFPG